MWTGSTREMLSSGWLVCSGTNLVSHDAAPQRGSHSRGHGLGCVPALVPVFSPSLSLNVRNASPSLQLAQTHWLRWQSLQSFSQQQTQSRLESLGRASIQSVIHFQKKTNRRVTGATPSSWTTTHTVRPSNLKHVSNY